MNPEREIELWRSAWRMPPAQPGATDANRFLAEHRRQERQLRFRYTFGLCFAVVLFAYAGYVLYGDFHRETLAWAAVVWITTVFATVFTVWNWRGLWGSVACSVNEYATSYERRSRATVRAARFGYWFLALQLSIAVPWLTVDYALHRTTPLRYGTSMGILTMLTIAFLAKFSSSGRRAKLEIARLQDFMRNSDVEDSA